MKTMVIDKRWECGFFQFIRSVVSDSLWTHGLQHARPPCPSPTPGACSNSCLLSRWCHPTVASCCPLFLLPSIFPSVRVFSNESVLRIRWPKHWSFSFSISPSNEYSGLISFRIDWFDLQNHLFYCWFIQILIQTNSKDDIWLLSLKFLSV